MDAVMAAPRQQSQPGARLKRLVPGAGPGICRWANLKCSCFTRHRRQAPTGRCANPTLVGGSDDEAARTDRCG